MLALGLAIACSLANPRPAAAQTTTAQADAAQAGNNPAEAAQVLRGKRLFIRCAACHEAGEPRIAKVGPHLLGIVGRQAGSVAGYGYSKGLAAGGFAWTDDKLLAWLERPTAVVPDTTMALEGLTAEADRRALLAYLRTLR
jgi:cytochrome c